MAKGVNLHSRALFWRLVSPEKKTLNLVADHSCAIYARVIMFIIRTKLARVYFLPLSYYMDTPRHDRSGLFIKIPQNQFA
jgi:hypothetical protein